ncbi:MAG: 2-dehydropantoate 2-reductase [SAR324 cluster bacterium]|nr:2-dehydropantoate 2-reductase [SAR324 cluster bacterium]
MEKIKVLIYGAGAIGVYFGGQLVKAGYEVTFIDTPERVELVQEKGLAIRDEKGDFYDFEPTIVDNPAGLDPQDLILVAVKAFHTYDISLNLLPILKPTSVIVSLQNGLENEKVMADLLGSNLVIGASPRFSGALLEGVTLIQQAPAFLYFGEMDNQPSERLDWLSKIFSHAGINHQISHNISLEIWKGALWNSTYNLVSALTRSNMMDISACQAMQVTLNQMLSEICAIAQAEGVTIPEEIVNEVRNQSVSMGKTKSNMLKDLELGQMPELEPLIGSLLKKAEDHGIPTPVNTTVYNLMILNLANYEIEEA